MKILNETPLKPAWIVASLEPPKLAATWIVKGTFELVPGGAAKDLEEGESPTGDLPYPDGPEDSVRYESDFAPFKPRTDLMLSGTCHVPNGKPLDVCRVTFEVGRWRKSLAVIGDRSWKRGLLGASQTPPTPFLSMPLRYERAFGGPAYPRNPAGRGHLMDLLPNVEDPDHLITSASEDAVPAGFAPIPRTWESRSAGLGTFNGAWLKERWPWFPKNFNWGHFNAAPRDQQLEGPLKGDESFALVNLRPGQPRFEGKLPGVRPQLFVVQSSGVHEAPLRLDTLWVDAEAGKLVLVWRGSLPVGSLKLEDVREVHVERTRLDAPALRWEEVVARHQKVAAEAKAAKEKEAAADKAQELAFEAVFAKQEKEVARLLEEAQAVGAAAAAEAKVGLAPLMAAGGVSAETTPKTFAESMKKSAGDPVIDEFQAKMPKYEAPTPEGAGGGDDAWTKERVLSHAAAGGSFAEQELSGLDLSGADLSGRNFNSAVLSGTILSGALLAGADFTRADLSKAVLDKADLTGATLARADLTGASLKGVRLDRADLERANFSKAALPEASLTGVKGDRSDFAGADLTGASLKKGRFFKGDFSGATLAKTDFSDAFLEHAIVQKATGPGAVFAGADLTSLHAGDAPKFPGASFKGARADRSYWEGAVLTQADFAGASLHRADFASCKLGGASFESADLSRSVLDDSVLDGARLLSANLFRASLQRASALKADFRRANLFESDLWDTVLDGALLEGADLRMTKREGS